MILCNKINLWAQIMLQQAAWYKLNNDDERMEASRLLAEHFARMIKFLNVNYILEIGAHEASFSRRTAILYPKTKILAFEANPEVWEKYNSEINDNFSNINYRNLAISDNKQSSNLITYSNLDGNNGKSALKRYGLLERKDGTDAGHIRVQTETLDNIMKQEGMTDNATLAIWIDAEGSTKQIFAGAKNALKQCSAIYLEVDCIEFWKDCWLERDVYTALFKLSFLPIFRDFLWKNQYNMVWVKASEVRKIDYFNGLYIQRCANRKRC